MTKQLLRTLIIEDSEDDAVILLHTLQKGGYNIKHQVVDTQKGLIGALSSQNWDVVLSDFSMPHLNGMDALRLIRERDAEIPFIFVSGTIGEERAVKAIQQGANDYVLKDNIMRIVPTVSKVLDEMRLKKENQATKSALEETKQRFQHAFQYSGSGIVLVDKRGGFLEVNEAFCQLIGHDEKMLLEMNFNEFIDQAYCSVFKNAMEDLLLQKKTHMQIELRLIHNEKRKLWVILSLSLVRSKNETKPPYYIIHCQDRTEERFFKEQLLHLKTYNALTGLLNRRIILDRVNQWIKQQRPCYILIINLDNFKLLNVSYTVDVGDNFLRSFSRQLKDKLYRIAEIGYLGANEFVLVSECTNGDACVSLVESIYQILSKPLLMQKNHIQLTASIGISQYPKDSERASELLNHAYQAMRHCKSQEGNSHCFFKRSIIKTVDKLTPTNELHDAVLNNEIIVHYQPKFGPGHVSISGLEALVRWKKGNAIIAPDAFIGIAEESSIIVEIGLVVLKKALSFYAQLRKKNVLPPESRIAVNISPKQFCDDKLLDVIKNSIEEAAVPASCLELEITETALMLNYEECLGMIQEFHKLGVRIAIDDFGTGYSSFKYLKDIRPHFLKIDKSFVQSCLIEENSKSIIASIISLAHQLNIKVTAEGVEEKSHYDFLLEHNCDEFQGHYFSHPLPEKECAIYLAKK